MPFFMEFAENYIFNFALPNKFKYFYIYIQYADIY
jgi:hypothetical protein